MHYKLVDEKPKTFVLVFEPNDELAGGLEKFASEQKLASASFKAIGALSFVKLGWLNWQTKQYEPSVFPDEQVELLSLIGDVASKDGEPQVHAQPRRRISGSRLQRPDRAVCVSRLNADLGREHVCLQGVAREPMFPVPA